MRYYYISCLAKAGCLRSLLILTGLVSSLSWGGEFRAPTHLVNIPVAYSAGVPFALGVNASIT
ncbi:MAG: hypothetical protein HY769_09750, partial [Candidatus Stahlbacteria bacterium]|nr:hypothetical protein [Candidatus Stahlbacteria bacterium]